MRFLNLYIILFFISSLNIQAQDQISSTKVDVYDKYSSEIANPVRLNDKAIYLDTFQLDKSQEYKVINFPVRTGYSVRPLRAAKMKLGKPLHYYSNHAFFSFGNKLGVSTNFSYSNSLSNHQSVATLFNHDSYKFQSTDKNAVNGKSSSLYVYYKAYDQKNIFRLRYLYDRSVFSSYGHKIEIDEDNIRNRFSYNKVSFSLESRDLNNERFKHNTSFFLSDLNERSENRAHLSTLIETRFKSYPINIDFSFDNFTNYNSQQQLSGVRSSSHNMIGFTSSVGASKFDIDFDISIMIDYETGHGLEILPLIEMSKELVKGILFVSAGVKEIKHRNTYYTLSLENPFIYSLGTNQNYINNFTQDLRTTAEKCLFFKFKNVLSKNESFSTDIKIGYVENLAFFDNYNINEHNRFLVFYKDVFQLNTKVFYSKDFNKLISLSLSGDYYYWSKKIPHKPKILIQLSSPINLRNKLKIYPILKYSGKRFSDPPIYIASEYGGAYYEIDSQVNFDLVAHYYYSKQFSGTVSIQNLFNSKKEIWRGYEDIGFLAKIGLKYLF